MSKREKVTISVDADLLETIRTEAEAAGLGVSEWLASAAQREANRAAAHRTLVQWEREHGPLSDPA